MPVGPGKYDGECTLVRELTKAQCVLLMVEDGNRGSGFSVQGTAEFTAMLPHFLRNIAAEIERTFTEGQV